MSVKWKWTEKFMELTLEAGQTKISSLYFWRDKMWQVSVTIAKATTLKRKEKKRKKKEIL